MLMGMTRDWIGGGGGEGIFCEFIRGEVECVSRYTAGGHGLHSPP